MFCCVEGVECIQEAVSYIDQPLTGADEIVVMGSLVTGIHDFIYDSLCFFLFDRLIQIY